MVHHRLSHAAMRLAIRDDEEVDCSATGSTNEHMGLRIASLFIILACGTLGALFPILARRLRAFAQRPAIFDFAKYFGSGVIIGTAFIHLLDPAIEELGSPCLAPAWGDYPYALAFTLLSIFSIFIVEVVAFRWGTSKLASLGLKHDTHGHAHGLGGHAAHGPEGSSTPPQAISDSNDQLASTQDLEKANTHPHVAHQSHTNVHGPSHVGDSALAQIVGIFILEFGVLFHSVLVGLALAVDEGFTILFVVLIFHQTFEGLGLGSRLAYLELPGKWNKRGPYLMALVFGLATPVGIAVGLGIRQTYAPNSATANIAAGIFDSLSAGVLIYTGLVELLAHEFLFNKDMLHASNSKLTFAICSMLLGCGLMALLGKWA